MLAWAIALCAVAQGSAGATLGIDGSRFTIGGRPAFLLGISYYGGLGATDSILMRDLDTMRRLGFNWLRVWATWSYRGVDVSAVDTEGRPREPYLSRLRRLVAESDRRGLIVDVTLTRVGAEQGGGVRTLEAHETAVRTLIAALGDRRNWYLDLANERDVGDARFVPTPEVRRLRDLALKLAPWLIVTASFGGRDLGERDVREALVDARLDFLAPHRPRHARSPGETERHTRDCLAAMQRIGRVAPVHYQEPFRRGYDEWEPSAADFLTDLAGAVRGGAAGWCLHNGGERRREDGRPWRSFDLRERGLFAQLDAEETAVVERAAATVRAVAREGR
ncbi:MAG TPA: hypothetical protein VLH79_08425 [Chthonomonadales bacterium]|nr:hypothetical protein [Chthonomonadales bacterium]